LEILGYIALIAVGMVLAMIGGGGSLLSVPILVYLFSLDVITASSYSLFIVGTTSLFGAWLKQKDQRVDMRSGFIFIACSVIAIFSTRRWIMPSIPDEVFIYDNITLTKRALILGLFALFAIISSLAILLKRNHNTTVGEESRLSLLVPVGFSTGILVGVVGAGGGFIILPSLSFFARLPFKMALGTTLMVIGMNSLLGFVGDVMNYEINWTFLLLITALAVAGMLIGDSFSRRIPVQHLRDSFGWIMLTMALAIVVTEFVL
jgi:uncharacterized membrane protein YfcA